MDETTRPVAVPLRGLISYLVMRLKRRLGASSSLSACRGFDRFLLPAIPSAVAFPAAKPGDNHRNDKHKDQQGRQCERRIFQSCDFATKKEEHGLRKDALKEALVDETHLPAEENFEMVTTSLTQWEQKHQLGTRLVGRTSETKELRNFRRRPGLKPPTSTHCNHIKPRLTHYVKIHWWPLSPLPLPPPSSGLPNTRNSE